MKKLIFLPVPDYLKLEGFQIIPEIPIPVEVSIGNEKQELENLNMEMILSGMLHVLETRETQQDWLDYYSKFVIYLRPDILSKIKDFKEKGLSDENFLKAHELIQKGKPQEALGFIKNFLEIKPLVWNGWFILGWALRLLGRYKDAEAAFRKTIELGGGGSDTRNELAICLMEMGDTKGATCELENALKEEPENVKILSNLGILAAKNGSKEKAGEYLTKVFELAPNDPLAKNYIKKFTLSFSLPQYE